MLVPAVLPGIAAKGDVPFDLFVGAYSRYASPRNAPAVEHGYSKRTFLRGHPTQGSRPFLSITDTLNAVLQGVWLIWEVNTQASTVASEQELPETMK